ncbi:ATP-binding protein [Streptomyces halstedii]|uniref:ATP-binding protein n=1 Tax=Streptomyces halstedii TaxID=1944 RepID=UPI00335C1C3D
MPSPDSTAARARTSSSPGQLTMALALTAESVGIVRSIVSSHARLWGLGHFVDSLELITTELLTNVVRHADSPGPDSTKSADLLLQPTLNGVIAVVHDNDPQPPVERPPADLGEVGRRLHLVRALASELIITPGTRGKDITAVLTDPEPHPAHMATTPRSRTNPFSPGVPPPCPRPRCLSRYAGYPPLHGW